MSDRRPWAERKEEKERFDDLFKRGKLGRAAYTLSLRFLNFTEREANDEANYIEGLKT